MKIEYEKQIRGVRIGEETYAVLNQRNHTLKSYLESLWEYRYTKWVGKYCYHYYIYDPLDPRKEDDFTVLGLLEGG